MRMCDLHVKRVCVLVAALLVVGCATTESSKSGAKKSGSAATQSLNLSGYPPEFRNGFTQGCDAAKNNDRSSKPKGDSQFAVGWNDGFEYCKAHK